MAMRKTRREVEGLERECAEGSFVERGERRKVCTCPW